MVRNKSLVLIGLISLIGLLLALSFFLLKRNSSIINQNKEELENAALVRVHIGEVLSNLHLLDLGIRGIALVQNKQLESSIDSAFARKDKIYEKLEQSLLAQKFPASRLNSLRDTVDQYFYWIKLIQEKLNLGKNDEAIRMINEDRGYNVWVFHKGLAQDINDFEDKVVARAQEDYKSALENSYLLQLLLFVIIIPTLIYLAVYTIKSFRLSEKLLLSEAERNRILFNQNEVLEKLVYERTQEIAAQNEEIISQNEEIQAHNEKLLSQQKEIEDKTYLLISRNKELEEASAIISQQKQIIEEENLQLSSELADQNRELRASNYELVQKTNRIEQFAYMISHNLRAPIARLSGLTNIFKYAVGENEQNNLIKKVNSSAEELDNMMKDLSEIMQIQRLSTDVFSEITFETTLEKIKQILENEIKETGAEFSTSFEVASFYSLPAYIDNIFYNLISNSIKYRHPKRKPVITISSKLTDDSILLSIGDNGLGVDTSQKENIFGLYKRFHFHVDGRGIGLYLVKSQIEMLRGKIEVESEINNGTVFRIALPNSKN